MSKYIKVKNQVPEILHLLCNHPDCPDWLRGKIWDEMSERSSESCYSLRQLRFLFESSNNTPFCEICEKNLNREGLCYRCDKAAIGKTIGSNP